MIAARGMVLGLGLLLALPAWPEPPARHARVPAMLATPYQQLRLVTSPAEEPALETGVEPRGKSVVRGLGLLAASPVLAMQCGMFAAICLGAAPVLAIRTMGRGGSAEELQARMDRFAGHLRELDADRRWQRGLTDEARAARLPLLPPEGEVQGEGVATLEAWLGEASLEVQGRDEVRFAMRLHLRLLDSTGHEASSGSRDFEQVHSFKEWFEGDGRRIHATVDQWLTEAAVIAVDEVALWPAFIDPRAFGQPAAGLQPALYEKRNIIGIKQLLWREADALNPELRWPDLRDIAGPLPEGLAIGPPSYVLQVMAWNESARKMQVFYERSLGDNAHRMEVMLQPCRMYFWRVIAHFDVGGMPFRTPPPARAYPTHWGYQLLTPDADGPCNRNYLWAEVPRTN